MFLHLPVILFTVGGVSDPVHAGIHTPCQVHAGINTPCPVHSGIDMATAADSTYPTGMHSCLMVSLHWQTPRQRPRKKWLVQNCMEVFILLRDKDQCKFPLGSVHILLVSVSVSVLVSDSVNEP